MNWLRQSLLIALLLCQSFSMAPISDFKSDQQKFPRVRAAFATKGDLVQAKLQKLNLDWGKYDLFMRGFKQEKELEVWAKAKTESTYRHLVTYDFCVLSGDLGPKRRQGDWQVPEGFYHIDVFNPASSYHLSMRVSYPNASDRILGVKGSLGGDIYIHGDCVSIGCIPITDDKIKELYILCVDAKNSGQSKIPVHIFPAKLADDFFQDPPQGTTEKLKTFWKNLEPGYQHFESTKKVPQMGVNTKGAYYLK